ncbi:hypothetical protein SteCoe_11543 [Stentor coeruleus]|uniref:Tyrosine specific protein phosphatases domain-containing protein n=1 Tax=Stentor coeruleus TaxID=5963 RepID=A0A1R2CCV9_9CILI|nr:hypothetical protein SteCoe_11543 [Stentor coeruleus]
MINKPSLVVHEKLKFLITDAPARENAEEYAMHLASVGVKNLVRACEGNYDEWVFEREGIKIHDLYFQDGTVPSRSKISMWLSLIKETFIENCSETSEREYIAVHCLSGLGRAPVLVGIALIEYGVDSYNAISTIRKNRPGALNSHQVKLLLNYRRTKVFNQTSCCVIY